MQSAPAMSKLFLANECCVFEGRKNKPSLKTHSKIVMVNRTCQWTLKIISTVLTFTDKDGKIRRQEKKNTIGQVTFNIMTPGIMTLSITTCSIRIIIWASVTI
jgi:hypothetical protein